MSQLDNSQTRGPVFERDGDLSLSLFGVLRRPGSHQSRTRSANTDVNAPLKAKAPAACRTVTCVPIVWRACLWARVIGYLSGKKIKNGTIFSSLTLCFLHPVMAPKYRDKRSETNARATLVYSVRVVYKFSFLEVLWIINAVYRASVISQRGYSSKRIMK